MRDFHAERLKRANKRKPSKPETSSGPEGRPDQPVPEAEPSPTGSRFPHTVKLSLNTDLYATIQELLASAHAAGDYRYTSLAALVRAAFRAYEDGAPLTAGPVPGPKRHSTLQLDDVLYSAYQALPQRKRWEILERAVRSFLKTF